MVDGSRMDGGMNPFARVQGDPRRGDALAYGMLKGWIHKATQASGFKIQKNSPKI
jgi:hypothetical protein